MVTCWDTCVLLSRLAGVRSGEGVFPVTAALPTRDMESGVGFHPGPVV